MRFLLVVLGLAGCVGAASASATGSDSISIRAPGHVRVRSTARIVLSGSDSAPASALGAQVDALLERPASAGGTTCKSDIATTEQNHPHYVELLLHHPVDPTHRHVYSVTIHTPRLRTPGRWRVCAWEYDNEGISSTSSPASHAVRSLTVLTAG